MLSKALAAVARCTRRPSRVSQVLAASRALTATSALCRGLARQRPPPLGLNLQYAYELDLAEQTLGKELEAPIYGGRLEAGRGRRKASSGSCARCSLAVRHVR